MAKSKTSNERIKRAYIDFLRQAMGRSQASLEAVAAALHRFESYTRFAEIMRRIATSEADGAKPEEILSQIVALASRKNG